jgi:hypothetical protein
MSVSGLAREITKFSWNWIHDAALFCLWASWRRDVSA